jgi:hypothetical protein
MDLKNGLETIRFECRLSYVAIGAVEAPIIRSLSSKAASALSSNTAFAVHRLWLAEFVPKVLQCASAIAF